MKSIHYAIAIALGMAAALVLSPSVWADTLYSNGPGNGNLASWGISGGLAVADSFTVSANSTMTGFDFWAWVDAVATPTSVDWSINTAPFGGTVVAFGDDAILANTQKTPAPAYGIAGTDSVYDSTVSGLSVGLSPGTYYLELSNAVANEDGSYTSGVDWDINNGPSTCYKYPDFLGGCGGIYGGSDSNTFNIYGTVDTAVTPEPPSMMLLGTGLLALGLLAGMKRKRGNRLMPQA